MTNHFLTKFLNLIFLVPNLGTTDPIRRPSPSYIKAASRSGPRPGNGRIKLKGNI